jgi:Ca2+/Na+ antiporter
MRKDLEASMDAMILLSRLAKANMLIILVLLLIICFSVFFLLKKSINVSTELNLTVSLCLHVTFIEYDDSQGCEVKEKEKARNQKHGAHTA